MNSCLRRSVPAGCCVVAGTGGDECPGSAFPVGVGVLVLAHVPPGGKFDPVAHVAPELPVMGVVCSPFEDGTDGKGDEAT